jgi:proteasome lid subunit RPN8/RPN11
VTLSFSSSAYDALFSHACGGTPEEVCGVLGGVDSIVTTIHRVPNVAEFPKTRYELDPEKQLEVIERAESEGDLIGFYHSHPEGPTEPSATDRAQATWPDAYYVIVSVPNESVSAWYWTGEEFLEESIGID